MSGLPVLRGHEPARTALAAAIRRNELPGSLLIHGPAGIGKQRLGLWLAQALLCESSRDSGEPCDACAACRLVLRLEHPDCHWFFPLPRPKGASGPDRLAEALEEARAGELAARRSDPWRIAQPGEPLGIYLAQVLTIRRLASNRPAMGRRQIFLIGGAELLVPQESSPEAANALLKVIEEPSTHTTFILTAHSPEGILPTLRSRLLPVRLRPLPEEDVAHFLIEEREVAERTARTAARLGQGSIGRSLGFLPAGDGPGPLEALRQQAFRHFCAACDRPATGRYAAAHSLAPTGARGAFSDTLEFLALWIRDLAAAAAGAEAQIASNDATTALLERARQLHGAAAGAPDALRLVDQARELAAGNVNPQLIMAWLLRRLNTTLHHPA